MIISTGEFLESERDRLIHDLMVELYSDKGASLAALLKSKPLSFDLADYANAIGFRESVIDKMVKEGLVNPVDEHAYTLSPKGRDIVESGCWLKVVQLQKSQQQIESELAEQKVNKRRDRTRIIVSVIMYITAFVAITLTILAYFKQFDEQ